MVCHGHVYRQQTYMYAFILTEDDKADGQSDGRTNGKKTYKLINKQYNTKKCIQADARTHRRTDTYTDNIRTGRQTDEQKHTHNYIINSPSNKRTVRQHFSPTPTGTLTHSLK